MKNHDDIGKLVNGAGKKNYQNPEQLEMKYKNTRFTRTIGYGCDFLEKYVGSPLLRILECAMYCGQRIGIVKIFEPYKNKKNINENVIPIEKGIKMKQEKAEQEKSKEQKSDNKEYKGEIPKFIYEPRGEPDAQNS